MADTYIIFPLPCDWHTSNICTEGVHVQKHLCVQKVVASMIQLPPSRNQTKHPQLCLNWKYQSIGDEGSFSPCFGSCHCVTWICQRDCCTNAHSWIKTSLSIFLRQYIEFIGGANSLLCLLEHFANFFLSEEHTVHDNVNVEKVGYFWSLSFLGKKMHFSFLHKERYGYQALHAVWHSLCLCFLWQLMVAICRAFSDTTWGAYYDVCPY